MYNRQNTNLGTKRREIESVYFIAGFLRSSILADARIKVHRIAVDAMNIERNRGCRRSRITADTQSHVDYTWYRSIMFKRDMPLSFTRLAPRLSRFAIFLFASARTRTRSSFPFSLASCKVLTVICKILVSHAPLKNTLILLKAKLNYIII